MRTISGVQTPTFTPSGTELVGDFVRCHRIGLTAAAVGFVCLFWPTLLNLLREWGRNPEFSHGCLVPLVSAGILLGHRRTLAALSCRRSRIGLAALLASLGIYFLGLHLGLGSVQRIAVFGCFLGGVAFLLGNALIAEKPFPFFFLLFAIPPPFFLLSPIRLELKELVTRLSADTLLFVGVPADPRGNVLAVGESLLEVADACSGIRSLMANVTLAVFVGYVLGTGLWKGVLLVATAVPIAVLVNVFRIVLTAVALAVGGIDLTLTPWHEILGFSVFLASFALLLSAAWLYSWLFSGEVRT